MLLLLSLLVAEITAIKAGDVDQSEEHLTDNFCPVALELGTERA